MATVYRAGRPRRAPVPPPVKIPVIMNYGTESSADHDP